MVWLCCLAPALLLFHGAWTDQLGANPAEALIRSTGDWALRMLCLVLAVTPLRVTLGWVHLAKYRRMLGLWVYAYASLHLLCYSWFDMNGVWDDIWQDVLKRPFITVGVLAWLCLGVLAATSPKAAIRWLGGQRWQALHKLVYGVAALAVLHFWWMRSSKNNVTEVVWYAAVLGLLLGWRVWHRWRKGRA